MLKTIAAAGAAIATATAGVALPASAASEYYLSPSYGVTMGEATDIRACPLNGEWGYAVCYNQVRSGYVSLLNVPVLPVTWETDRAYTIDCRNYKMKPFPSTVRAQVGNQFCPVIPLLPTAPFLEHDY